MVLPAEERPQNLRTILLAYPKTTRRTEKYVPPVYVPGKFETGVKPSAVRGEPKENWRLNTLAIPNWVTEKYVEIPVKGVGSGVSASTLAGQGTKRTNDLSKPNLRYLIQNRKAFAFLGPKFMAHMNKTIDQSWNCLYNGYKKQLAEIKKKRDARKASLKRMRLATGKKGAPPGKAKTEKELKAEKEKRIATWCALRAQPKKVFPPRRLRKRKIANLVAIRTHMFLMAEPKIITRKYIRPSIDPTYIDPLRVTPAARAYVPSERVLELAKNPPHRLRKDPVIIPGAVKKSALKCKVSPRFLELATPKKKAAEKDSELKENPFQISPNALKAKPTARIKELAKPIER